MNSFTAKSDTQPDPQSGLDSNVKTVKAGPFEQIAPLVKRLKSFGNEEDGSGELDNAVRTGGRDLLSVIAAIKDFVRESPEDIFPPKPELRAPEPRRRKRASSPSPTTNETTKKPRPSAISSKSKNPYQILPSLSQELKQAESKTFWHTKEELETFLHENQPVPVEAGPSTKTSSLPAPSGPLSAPPNDAQTHIEDPHSIRVSLSSYWPSTTDQPEFCLEIRNQGVFRAYGFFGWRKRRRKRDAVVPKIDRSEETNDTIMPNVGVDEERAMVGIRFTFLAENETAKKGKNDISGYQTMVELGKHFTSLELSVPELVSRLPAYRKFLTTPCISCGQLQNKGILPIERRWNMDEGKWAALHSSCTPKRV